MKVKSIFMSESVKIIFKIFNMISVRSDQNVFFRFLNPLGTKIKELLSSLISFSKFPRKNVKAHEYFAQTFLSERVH